MSKLTREQVLKLAQLSRLRLTDDEVATFQEELSSILSYVEQLDSVNVDGLQPTYQVTGMNNTGRSDDIQKYQAEPKTMLKRAPSHEGSFIKVGRMI